MVKLIIGIMMKVGCYLVRSRKIFKNKTGLAEGWVQEIKIMSWKWLKCKYFWIFAAVISFNWYVRSFLIVFDCSLTSEASFFWCVGSVGSVSVCCFGLGVMFFFYCVSIIKQIPENFIGEVSVSVVTMRSCHGKTEQNKSNSGELLELLWFPFPRGRAMTL
ncbi:hypothetical protein P8452_14682 [Trifolium repens]|nr:hypothetical protein P8452_14682 [Trifolium repens]